MNMNIIIKNKNKEIELGNIIEIVSYGKATHEIDNDFYIVSGKIKEKQMINLHSGYKYDEYKITTYEDLVDYAKEELKEYNSELIQVNIYNECEIVIQKKRKM